MSTTRREFIQNGLSFVALGIAMPTFLMRAASAQAAPGGSLFGGLPAIPGGKTLVVIEMAGGNDGLNTVIPYAAPEYRSSGPPSASRRPASSNSTPRSACTRASSPSAPCTRRAISPSSPASATRTRTAATFRAWTSGRPASRQIDARDRTGWLARYFDADGHFQGNPLSGVSLGSALPLALFASRRARHR